ncbi:MAG: hypothetical protein ILO10_04780 [Kiritimatiellae bacterium]|nr:hypothetical protein [Kiritimatiellia bacterium]
MTNPERESKRPPTWDFFVCCGLALAAFVFILYRIFNADLVGDEWGMWKDSIRPGLKALLTFQHKDTQSHFLQGLCAIPFLKYLPIGTVPAIRLPSLLMFPVYAWAGMRLARRLASSWFRILFFAAWIGPHIVLEYFGLARGYAFLLAWGGVAFAGLIEAYDSKNTPAWRDRWSKISIFSAGLALLSLLTFSYGYFLVTVLLLLRYYLEAEGPDWTRLAVVLRRGGFVIETGVVLVVFYLPRYLFLRHTPLMQWGGTRNFVSDSFASLIGCVTYVDLTRENVIFWLGMAVFGVCVANLLAWLWQLRRERPSFFRILQSPLALAAILLFGLALCTQVVFWVAGIRFLLERAVLYLWPIIVMFLGFSWQEIRWGGVRWLNVLLLCGVVGWSACTYDTCKTYEQRWDAQNKEISQVLHDLAQQERQAGRPLVVGMTDNLKYTTWYYFENESPDMAAHPQLAEHPVFRLHGDNLLFTYSLNYGFPWPFPPVWHHHPHTDYYLLALNIPGNKPNGRLMDLTPVRYFEKSDVALYKAKTPTGRGGCDPKRCMICQALSQIAGVPIAATEE